MRRLCSLYQGMCILADVFIAMQLWRIMVGNDRNFSMYYCASTFQTIGRLPSIQKQRPSLLDVELLLIEVACVVDDLQFWKKREATWRENNIISRREKRTW